MQSTFFRDLFFIAKGAKLVLGFSLAGFAIGLVLSLILIIISLNKKLRPFVRFYISLFRGTPLLCQVAAFIYFLPNYLPIEISCGLAFGINCSAYLAEIFRCFIEQIPKEQIETAVGLGLNKYQITRYIIIPQMMRYSIPLFINEIIALAKDVSILGSFGIMEVFMRGKIIGSLDYNYGRSLMIVAFVYYFIVMCISQIERLVKIKKR